PEPLSAVILVQYLRAAAAGVHMLAFTPWPHFVSTANGRALGDFVDRVKYRPRGSSATSWLPPQVHGVSGSATERSGSLAWSGDVFPGVADFAWSEWPSFFRFEVWRGSHAGFGTSDGRLVKLSTTPGATSIALDPSRKFYKVLAASREGRRGALSDAWVLDPAGSGPANPPGGPTPTPGPVATPTPGPGGGGGPRMRGIPSCKLADPRYGGDPALAPFERRTFSAVERCGVPAGATAIMATILVLAPAEDGSAVLEPGDAVSRLPIEIPFTARRTVS